MKNGRKLSHWSTLISVLLKVLNLSDNQLTEFRLSEELQDIEWLNIQGNPLKFPAEEITIQGPEATLALS